jgi:hypothetical protein
MLRAHNAIQQGPGSPNKAAKVGISLAFSVPFAGMKMLMFLIADTSPYIYLLYLLSISSRA